MNKYENKEEAEKILEKSRKKMTYTFCPMINNKCDKNCICYYDGDVVGNNEGMMYIVKKARCNNKMFKG